ncbi:hypothetical protein [Bacteriovorax sp. DB6_IX]|uniref:hypothetical protein n=1 Tax=Bacteriovorax sp. DB6_IX TaxID=1353530 RepID=UPI00038A31C1|nr:hypothetical protein [Bacteriovorax sp. DB6_IX]EQC49840.1 hypothetical protein M901_2346 [Bacteriovorax sp. DB6_IX]
MRQKQWYSKENGKFVVEVQVESIDQLYDKRDPNPFRIKDLDDDVVEYILSSVGDIGYKKVGKLKIFIKKRHLEVEIRAAEAAVKDYFLYRQDITEKKIRAIFTTGFKALLIGLTFLACSIAVSASVGKVPKSDFLALYVKEGLLLLGWVSMWKPINIFLYEWWPLIELKNTFKKLSEIDLEFKDY